MSYPTEAAGRLPPCPACGHQTDDNALGQINRAVVCGCVRCGSRFCVEEVPFDAAETDRRLAATPKAYRKVAV